MSNLMNGFSWGCMIYLSNHMWNDEHSTPKDFVPLDMEYHENISTDEGTWDKIMPFLQERKFNLVLIDVGDGVKYDSHPEISAPNAWSKELLKEKLKKMREMGLEPIPKLNFSAGHDTWLKKYRRMISTPEYYQVCADLIKEVCEIFDKPRLFHIGFDEEGANAQWNYEIIISRGKALWWHDLYFFVEQCEKNGARAWMWSDHLWHDEKNFLEKMPKSVVQSNWYYNEFKEFADYSFYGKRAIECYEILDKHGFDQIPCGSLYGTNENLMQTLAFGKEKLSTEHLMGYLVAPWLSTVPKQIYGIYHNAHNFYEARKFSYPETLE